ncbi:hypothetical protein [Lentzea albida]|uniref:Uncharacterized protein n=1 Tax=Lentzea albida TaxID=65499 RepID=A0A1H9AEK4_9PSEU|nr:hypothetical protein [Lentzea albida]SEP74388.1 hypothetical protein SAMN04488000_101110 [Lentzea albida]
MTDKIPPGFDHERFRREASRKPNAVVGFLGSLLAALSGLPQETARRHDPAPDRRVR